MALDKEQLFLSEPIGDKPTNSLRGISREAAKALSEENFDFAYQMYGQFCLLKKDEDLFIKWLSMFQIKRENAKKCFNCLKSYNENL